MKHLPQNTPENLIGKRFNRLVAIAIYSRNPTRWKCRCVCGGFTIVLPYNLKSGAVKSCGCLLREFWDGISQQKRKYQSTRSVWRNMKNRCQNKNVPAYKDYGGRGIKVCKRWNKFELFVEDMGLRPEGLCIERIDNNGNYEPGNCEWTTLKKQSNNKRNNLLISIGKETKTCSQWADQVGIGCEVVRQRWRRGWRGERLLIPLIR